MIHFAFIFADLDAFEFLHVEINGYKIIFLRIEKSSKWS
jgi:hypothetical protein